jgi:hypothetical protein
LGFPHRKNNSRNGKSKLSGGRFLQRGGQRAVESLLLRLQGLDKLELRPTTIQIVPRTTSLEINVARKKIRQKPDANLKRYQHPAER